MRCARCESPLEQGALVCGQCGAMVGARYGPAREAPVRAAARASAAGRTPASIVDRVKTLLRAPAAAWPAIADAPVSPYHLVTGYVAPLAAIGAVALFIGQVAFGEPVPLLGRVRADVATGLAAALLLLAFAVIAVLAESALVNALAPHFGGQRDALRARKLVAYSHTPVWLAGIVNAFPGLWPLLPLAALDGLYLGYIGLPILMRCPPARALPYSLAVGAGALVLFVAFAALVTLATGLGPEIL
jgi:hypothetical protein